MSAVLLANEPLRKKQSINLDQNRIDTCPPSQAVGVEASPEVIDTGFGVVFFAGKLVAIRIAAGSVLLAAVWRIGEGAH